MSRHPDHATSNYGWALWHLEQAKVCPVPEGAQVHATAANARAVLAAIDASPGQDFIGSTWTTTPSHQPIEEMKA